MTASIRRRGPWLEAATALALVATFAALALAQGQPQLELLAAGSVDQAEKALAQKVAHETLGAWKAGRFAPLGAEYTDQMKAAMPPGTQEQAYLQMKALFGDYQSMSFAEAHASRAGPRMVVYRFRGTFSASTDRPEIRVVIDAAGKVAGLWVRPWLAPLQ